MSRLPPPNQVRDVDQPLHEDVRDFLVGVNDWVWRKELEDYCRHEGVTKATFERAVRDLKADEHIEVKTDRSGVGEDGQRGRVKGSRVQLTDKGRRGTP